MSNALEAVHVSGVTSTPCWLRDGVLAVPFTDGVRLLSTADNSETTSKLSELFSCVAAYPPSELLALSYKGKDTSIILMKDQATVQTLHGT